MYCYSSSKEPDERFRHVKIGNAMAHVVRWLVTVALNSIPCDFMWGSWWIKAVAQVCFVFFPGNHHFTLLHTYLQVHYNQSGSTLSYPHFLIRYFHLSILIW
jgi:hypothetical protein